MAKKVKIQFSQDPSYILTILRNEKGGSVRMMKEGDVADLKDQSTFEISGEKTQIENNGDFICGNFFGPGVVTCKRWMSKKTFFKLIDMGDKVKLQTDGKKCLAVADFDSSTKAYYLHLKKCKDSPKQEFKIIDINDEKYSDHEKSSEQVSTGSNMSSTNTTESCQKSTNNAYSNDICSTSQNPIVTKSSVYNPYVSTSNTRKSNDCLVSMAASPEFTTYCKPSSYVSVKSTQTEIPSMTSSSSYRGVMIRSNLMESDEN